MNTFNAKNVTRKINTFISNLDRVESNAYDLSKESLGVLLEHGNATPLAHLINELNSKSRSIKAKRAVKVIKVVVSLVPNVASTTKKFKDSGLSLHYRLIDKPENAENIINSLPTFDEILSSILLEEERKKAERLADKESETPISDMPEEVITTETETPETTIEQVSFTSQANNLISQLEALISSGKDTLKSLSLTDRNELERLTATLNAYKAFSNTVNQPLKKAA